MNKRLLLGGAVFGLVGVGLYKVIRARAENSKGAWTIDEIPDLTGKVIIVTGANSGVGYEAAKEFARQGAQTVLACRNMEKAAAAQAQIQAEIPTAGARIMHLDLASIASVRQFAEEFNSEYDRLDVLVNNAGIMWVPYAVTEDGFESQFGTNHLGHFALTGLMVERLLATPGSRVVNVSSGGHRMGRMNFDNLMFTDGRSYSGIQAYSRSKLANLLFTYELQRRYDALGADALAVGAHPGGSDTNLGGHMDEHWYFRAFRPLAAPFIQSAAMGALPTLRAAVDPEVQGGDYFGPGGFMEQRGYPVRVPSSSRSQNLDDAAELWRVSEELTGVYYDKLD